MFFWLVLVGFMRRELFEASIWCFWNYYLEWGVFFTVKVKPGFHRMCFSNTVLSTFHLNGLHMFSFWVVGFLLVDLLRKCWNVDGRSSKVRTVQPIKATATEAPPTIQSKILFSLFLFPSSKKRWYVSVCQFLINWLLFPFPPFLGHVQKLLAVGRPR